MMIVVKRTQALMPLDSQSKPLRDPLNGQVAKLLKFKLIHNCQLSIVNYQLRRYSSVFVYSPVWFE